ncbi:MAG TPA: ATP-binding protein [Candidatus Methylomirabilis sp.]|nr:ATP-binding protein [Candidatus Methylomirabilis sp.]
MGSLVYLRLIGFTAGTLLQLFWMVVIVGYRRQRNFERVLFFLCLALFLFYSGSLLALNAQIYYALPPPLLQASAITLLCVGLCLLPPLLIHLHFEFAETRELRAGHFSKRLALVAGYAPILYFALHYFPQIATSPGFDFLVPGNALGRGYGVWLAIALVVSAGWEVRFGSAAPDRPQRLFHSTLAGLFVLGTAMALYLHVLGRPLSVSTSVLISTALAWLSIPPFTILIYLVLRFNFLQIGRQKNLVYAALSTFLALLYLSLVRRVGVWLEPVLPPEASAAILLFVLVIFIEPLQRVLGRRLQQTAQRELDRVQKLIAEIQQEARQGNLERLTQFIAGKVRETFELASVEVRLHEPAQVSEGARQMAREMGITSEASYGEPRCQLLVLSRGQKAFLRGRNAVATLRVLPHGASISGETRAALEFLCEQLPGALDLCRLIEEKLRLERELAERERLAVLGQMAASISHNLKNPLGSIKTILQVQMENRELPAAIRGETKMVLEEISRLSAKLNQLLQFSRPAVRPGDMSASCDAQGALEEVISVLRHEAERRGVALETKLPERKIQVAASAEALGDIVSNLVVNALEAAQRDGRVTVSATTNDGAGVLIVEDDGPGIPASAREKILQPFFTTKAQGTGLGLAIVARRVAEFGGSLDWDSPANDGRGTRFKVTLPIKEVAK